MIGNTMKWPLYSSSIMRRSVSGKLVVLGDAAHAMVPYMSQGKFYRTTSYLNSRYLGYYSGV